MLAVLQKERVTHQHRCSVKETGDRGLQVFVRGEAEITPLSVLYVFQKALRNKEKKENFPV